MPKSRPPYPAEFRRQMVELVRAGRTPDELSQEFEPSAEAIRQWVKQADRDDGRRAGGLTSAEREELHSLRRENRRLRQERDILSKAAAWFARETGVIPSGSFAACGRRSSPAAADPHHSRGLARHLRRAPHPCRTRGRGRVGRAQADRPADAWRRPRRRLPSHAAAHHPARAFGPAGPGSGRAMLRRRGAGSALGRRHQLRGDPGGLSLSRRRAGCLQPPDRRLGDGEPPAHRAGPGRPRDGDRSAQAGQGHPSFRPGQPIYFARLRRTLPGGRCAAVDGIGGRCLRQRHVRELLRHARMRASGAPALPLADRGPHGHLQLHRKLVQPRITTHISLCC
ncbi:MAG: transposase [Geminicoccaceae bacterium]|nr:transposase [Geminicoccaceae bacterium]